MIRRGNLNLVVVQKETVTDKAWLQQEISQLEKILMQVLAPANVARSCEVADLNRYQHYTQHAKVLRYLQHPLQEKPFVFLLNLN